MELNKISLLTRLLWYGWPGGWPGILQALFCAPLRVLSLIFFKMFYWYFLILFNSLFLIDRDSMNQHWSLELGIWRFKKFQATHWKSGIVVTFNPLYCQSTCIHIQIFCWSHLTQFQWICFLDCAFFWDKSSGFFLLIIWLPHFIWHYFNSNFPCILSCF